MSKGEEGKQGAGEPQGRKLTAKELAFCREYLIDLNATQAAIRAGYNERSARQVAHRLLTKDYIQQEIQQLMDKRAEKVELTAEWILAKTQKLALICLGEEEIETTNLKGELVKRRRFDSLGAGRALELLGKHKKLFTDKVEHSGSVQASVTVNIDTKYEES